MPRVNRPPAGPIGGPEDGWRDPVPRLQEPRYSQSLERGLAILECFTPQRPVWGITDLADELGMSRSTTHRYVLTLTALGHLVQGSRRKYRLGLAVTELGMSALSSTGLREHARGPLRELGRRTSYTLAIGMLDGQELVYLDRIRATRRGQRPIELDLSAGSRLPPHCCAMGKLLLAGLPETERRLLIAELTLSSEDHARSQARTGCAPSSRDVAARRWSSARRSWRPGCTRSRRRCVRRRAR